YTFAKYKVLWKEQVKNFAAVAVNTFNNTLPDVEGIYFDDDKPFVMDSKVLMLECSSMKEAYYVSGILNSPVISSVIDGYAISTNRGTHILKNIRIPQFDETDPVHVEITEISKELHENRQNQISSIQEIKEMENHLNPLVLSLYSL